MSVETDLLKRAYNSLTYYDLMSEELYGIVADIKKYLDNEAAKQAEGTPCCQAPIVHYRSLNKKVCADCGKEYDWYLKNGQMPLIKHTR